MKVAVNAVVCWFYPKYRYALLKIYSESLVYFLKLVLQTV